MGALSMPNHLGDTTIAWTDDQDEEWAAILQKKMDEGVTFYIIEPRLGNRKKLKRVADAMTTRQLAIPDEDLAAFVVAGKGELVKTPEKPARTVRRARTGKEAASSETVGIRPRAGG
jgi:hypothetical protein